jgi:hypothetical protein
MQGLKYIDSTFLELLFEIRDHDDDSINFTSG